MDYKIKLKNLSCATEFVRLPVDAQGFVIARALENFPQKDILIIAENDSEMANLAAQIGFFCPEVDEKFTLLNFPAWDCLPFDRASPKPLISSSRIRCLYKITNRLPGQKFLIITSINAILQKTLSPVSLRNYGLQVRSGSKISIEQISQFLVMNGYNRATSANCVGEFAVRGGIVDFVTEKAADLIGYRLDFLGDEIEVIKTFDPLTQITSETVKEIEILPTSEVILNDQTVENFRKNYRQNFGISSENQLYSAILEKRFYTGCEHWLPFFYEEKLVSFFDYFSHPVVFLNQKVFSFAQTRCEIIAEYYQSRIDALNHEPEAAAYHPISPDLLYLSLAEFAEKTSEKISFNSFETSNLNQRILDLEIKPVPDFALAGRANKKDPIELMKEFVLAVGSAQIFIACLTEGFKERAARVLADYGITCQQVKNFSEIKNVKPGKAAIGIMPLGFGFYAPDLIIIGEQAIFGEKIIRKKGGNKEASQRILEEGLSINLGELVVHRDHGIGKFDGLHMISAGGVKCEMVKLTYSGGDVLFVPVDEINLITRYGAENPLIQLDRLGGAAWKNRKDKVKKRIKVAAEELLKIAAARHLKKAPVFVPNQHFYDEFKARFSFVETEDQIRAIEEVEEDLQRGSPMDRLICGDVGFGKTEVAMRAAAVVAFSNIDKNGDEPQIAIIAPTTLLVRQHYKNFTKRFAETDIRIAQLSRLIGASETKKIKAEIESGAIEIVIGTHALLQKTIKFKNLALVIIDEEQHFGVAQKERLKELRNEVHVLTLSATPIPRTLQMSLTGVKDLSLIATTPLDRLATRNFVMPYDSVITREAVMREYNRGGRVFFVVPRIRDIEEMEARLKILLPEIKITHAHGQMTPSQLDQIMNDFVDGKIDLLLSTTIIESGIDIPEANTIIIYKAEMFGLAQLYQLRGRVGRSKMRGYAYFMLDNRKKISADSRKKLEVMQNLDSLGVGFTIASHDMDIRGSGNLLGDEQSGHVKETGVELYQQLLLETIENLKNGQVLSGDPQLISQIKNDDELLNNEISVQIKLGISLLIPESYMPDLQLRMSFYKKIANLHDVEKQDSLRTEMIDRFGKIPEEISNLMEVARLKFACKKIGIERLEGVTDGILVSFKNNQFQNPDKLLSMIFSSGNKVRIHAGQRVFFLCDMKSESAKISSTFAIIKKLEELL